MEKNERLVDLLQKEINRLNDNQKSAFREALKSELPKVIRKAGRTAKKTVVKENEK